jgi:hypothetical protein
MQFKNIEERYLSCPGFMKVFSTTKETKEWLLNFTVGLIKTEDCDDVTPLLTDLKKDWETDWS